MPGFGQSIGFPRNAVTVPTSVYGAAPAGVGGLTTVTAALAAPQVGNGAYQNLLSVALAAGTWLVLAEVTVQDTTAVATPCEALLSNASALGTGGYASGQLYAGDLAGGNEGITVTLVASVILAAPGTVYLNWIGAASATAITTAASGAATNIVAVRTA